MVTINDIAKKAGVSHGTVSNVINGRGNVSAEKIKAVWEAAGQLGYKMNTAAQELRQKATKTVALILPSTEYDWCAVLYEGLQREMTALGYSVRLFSTQNIQAQEKQMLAAALEGRVCAIITASCLDNAPAYYKQEAGRTPVLFLNAGERQASREFGVGFSFHGAGQEIARYIKTQNAKMVGIFLSGAQLCIGEDFLQGLQKSLQADFIAMRVLTCMDHQIEVQAFSLFHPDSPYDFIICSDTRRLQAVQNAHSYAGKYDTPRYITLSPHSSLGDAHSLYYGLDYKMMAHRAAKAIVGHLEKSTFPTAVVLKNKGFPTFPRCNIQTLQELNMLTVASPSSEALMLLAPHLEKTQGIRLNLSIMSLDDIYSLLKSSQGITPYDLIRMDMAWLDELAALVYSPLSEIDWDWDRLFQSFRPEFTPDYSEEGGVRCSLPFDPSTQLLFYRKDLLENPFYKRMYFEVTRQELEVPKTFGSYNQVARFFTQSMNPQSPTLYGTTVAIGSAMVGASEYYVRLLGMGGSILDTQGHIALNSPQALQALENLTEAYRYSDQNQYQWWKSVLQGFSRGNSAMTVVFMNYASDILNGQQSSIAGNVGYAPVPGGKPLIGGGIVGIARTTKNTPAACRFLDWLYSPAIASAFTLLGGLSPCRWVYENRDLYEKYPWLTATKKSFPMAQRRHKSTAYQNFSQHHLEKVLAFEVRNAVLGVTTPAQALKQAQKSCEAYFIRN